MKQFRVVTMPRIVNSNRTGLVILAGASVRSLAESAVMSGITPLCVDMFGDADLRLLLRENGHPDPVQISEFSDLADATRPFREDTPLIWTGGLENHPAILQELSEQRSVCGIQSTDLPDFRSRAGMQAIVEGTECHLPAVIRSAVGLERQATQQEWLVKPVNSSGGLGIGNYKPGRKVRSTEYLQQKVDGIAASALFYHDGRRVEILGVSAHITGDAALGGSGFCFGGCVGPVTAPPRVRAVIKEVGQRIGAAGLPGVFGADFIVDADDVWLIEVNPRITASHELYDFMTPQSTVLKRQLSSHVIAAQQQQRPAGDFSDLVGEGHSLMLARLIVYLKHDTALTTSELSTLLDFRRSSTKRATLGCWLADIPQAGELSTGLPFCSIYHVLRSTPSGWRPTCVDSRTFGMDGIVARIAGVAHLDSVSTAIHYGSLFE